MNVVFIDIGKLIKQFPQRDVIWVNIEKKGPTKQATKLWYSKHVIIIQTNSQKIYSVFDQIILIRPGYEQPQLFPL